MIKDISCNVLYTKIAFSTLYITLFINTASFVYSDWQCLIDDWHVKRVSEIWINVGRMHDNLIELTFSCAAPFFEHCCPTCHYEAHCIFCIENSTNGPLKWWNYRPRSTKLEHISFNGVPRSSLPYVALMEQGIRFKKQNQNNLQSTLCTLFGLFFWWGNMPEILVIYI